MDWLIPAVIATFFNTFFLSLVYLYLYFKEKALSLKIFTVSWFVYSIRFIFMILHIYFQNSLFLLFNQLLVLTSSIILLYGFYIWCKKQKLPVYWLIISIAGFWWIVGTYFIDLKFMLFTLPTFAVTGTIYIVCGILLFKDKTVAGFGKNSVVFILIIWGLHKMNYPFLRPVEWFAPIGYLIAAFCTIITAIGMILIYFDKAKREAAANEQALKETKNFYENIIESIEDGIWVSDAADVIYYTNKGMINIAGVEKDRIIGKNVFNDFPEETIKDFKKYYSSAKETRQLSSYTCKVKTPAGRTSFQTGVLIPVVKGNKFNGMICTIHDYTERKRYEEELKKSLDEKQVLLRELNHRVKNNLNVVLSLIEYQSTTNPEAELEEVLQKLKSRIYAIALIHTQLHHQTNISTLNFKTYLEELAEYIITSLGENPDILHTHFDVNEFSLHIDHVKTLGLIINECLTNSIKYAFTANSEKRMDISLSLNKNKYMLVIQDNGKGLPKDIDTGKGSGLYLVEQLIEELDGVSTIDTDNGTKITIIFPGVMIENTSR